MKTLRLSDEDYQALLQALTDAADNTDILSQDREDEGSYFSADIHRQENKEAKRLHDLIKPMEYPEEPHTLLDEKMRAMNEAMALLRIAGIDVSLTVTKQIGGEEADLMAHHVEHFLPPPERWGNEEFKED
jgi:hypothetical protein